MGKNVGLPAVRLEPDSTSPNPNPNEYLNLKKTNSGKTNEQKSFLFFFRILKLFLRFRRRLAFLNPCELIICRSALILKLETRGNLIAKTLKIPFFHWFSATTKWFFSIKFQVCAVFDFQGVPSSLKIREKPYKKYTSRRGRI